MAAFGLGDNDKMIGFADAQGVLFSAAQGLNAKLETQLAAKDAEIATLRERLTTVEADHNRDIADLRASHQKEIADLRLAVEVLMARTAGDGGVAQTR